MALGEAIGAAVGGGAGAGSGELQPVRLPRMNTIPSALRSMHTSVAV
jgi:hypothetical protein